MVFTLKYRRPVVWEVFPSISRISFPRFHGSNSLPSPWCLWPRATRSSIRYPWSPEGSKPARRPARRSPWSGRGTNAWDPASNMGKASTSGQIQHVCAVFVSFRFLFHCHHGVCTPFSNPDLDNLRLANLYRDELHSYLEYGKIRCDRTTLPHSTASCPGGYKPIEKVISVISDRGFIVAGESPAFFRSIQW